MNTWSLPTSVHVAGVDWDIRTDFRIVIDVLIAFDNPEYDDTEKWMYCIMSLVKGYENLERKDYHEMCQALIQFIDMGIKDDGISKRKVLDWEHDASLLVTAVNKVLGREVRADSYLHWWSFLSAYMEIDNKTLFSNILSIRIKKSKGKKLEKWEQEFYRENKSLIDIKRKLTAEEEEEERLLEEMFG